MRTERPVLSARWTELLVLNFPVPAELIRQFAPPGTEPDLHDNQAYASIVGFRFRGARLFGLPIPGHTQFAEINLRYYVQRCVEGEARRGVVFVKEIAPKRAIGATANWLYNENYITRPMRSNLRVAGSRLSTGDSIEYAWQTRSGRPHGSRLLRGLATRRWNRLAACVAAPLRLPPAGSFEQFIVEHYWGYVRGRDGRTREYRVLHEPWRVAPVDEVVWDCDLAATYEPPFAEYLAAPPVNALIADGSPIQLFRGRCL